MRKLAIALALAAVAAQPALAIAPGGSPRYQRLIRCAGVAGAAMVFAVEVETTGQALEHDGRKLRFAAPESYQSMSNNWLKAAVRTGERNEKAARRDLNAEMEALGAQVERSGDKAGQLHALLGEFDRCKRK